MDKLKDEQQVWTTSICWVLGYATVEGHNFKKSRMHQMVQTK
jgi:hypothetical protein